MGNSRDRTTGVHHQAAASIGTGRHSGGAGGAGAAACLWPLPGPALPLELYHHLCCLVWSRQPVATALGRSVTLVLQSCLPVKAMPCSCISSSLLSCESTIQLVGQLSIRLCLWSLAPEIYPNRPLYIFAVSCPVCVMLFPPVTQLLNELGLASSQVGTRVP